MEARDAAERVILVDTAGREIGTSGKLAAHANGGVLHLGFSIMVFNSQGDMLLQRRAAGKYHFAGYWSNSCCGHPRPGEATDVAARRRLCEELGFDIPLRMVEQLSYHAHDKVSGLTEKEWLSIYTGVFDDRPHPAAEEVGDWRWVSQVRLMQELESSPETFTPWFRLLVEQPSVLGLWQAMRPDAGQVT